MWKSGNHDTGLLKSEDPKGGTLRDGRGETHEEKTKRSIEITPAEGFVFTNCL